MNPIEQVKLHYPDKCIIPNHKPQGGQVQKRDATLFEPKPSDKPKV